MKILISYFYQIRFFQPNYIPLSTAIYDPKWYHADGRTFKNNKGVYNGYRAEPFVPIMHSNGECNGSESCKYTSDTCEFLKNYYNQLKELDYNSIWNRFEKFANHFNLEFENPIPVLIVYESPNNPCSERIIIKKWFKDNGYILEEFDKNKI